MKKSDDAARARAEHKKLGEEIAAHDRAYYQEDAPVVSDADYDALRRRYEALEQQFPELAGEDSLSRKVGAAPAEKFAKVTHAVPMLSLGNIFSDEEVEEFVARVKRFLGLGEQAELAFTAEPKIDGLSCSLRYERGFLVSAATRGDGLVGEDVTANVGAIADIPQILAGDAPEIIDVRGEVYMSHADFAALNARQAAAGKTALRQSAQRGGGLAAPTRPQGDGAKTAQVFCLRLGGTGLGAVEPDMPADSQMGMMAAFRAFGFKVNPLTRLCYTAEQMLAQFRDIESRRATLGYDIDGVVYKVNDLALQQRLGFVVARAAVGDGP